MCAIALSSWIWSIPDYFSSPFEYYLSVQLQTSPVYRARQVSPHCHQSITILESLAQTSLMICTAERKVSNSLCCVEWRYVMGRLIFFNPQAPVFSLDLTPLPRGIFLNFLMDCLTSQCVCEAVPRNLGRTTGKELHDFAREHFVITFQVETQHAGPWFGCLTCPLNKLELRKVPRSL